ncbi:hypothetical protein ASD06_08100 [Angustibacter sp. Root456]|nr:hypothetical protein ASD06_08100 [Angustibacter sp. Root456]
MRRPAAFDQVLLAVFTALTAALALVLAAVALRPSLATSLPQDLRRHVDSGAWETILLLAALGVAAFLCYWLPRRRQVRPFPVVAGAALSLLAVTLAMAAYWGCSGRQAPFWTALHWTMALFVGNVMEPFGSSASCPAPMPLALQTARIAALATTFGVAAALVSVFRAQWDRLRARVARSVLLVTGIGDDALRLLERLAAHRPFGTSIVVLERDPAHPNIASARALGALVVLGDPAASEQLGVLLRDGRNLRAAYLLGERSSANIEVASRIVELVRGRGGRDGTVPRLVVRIDDPWQAEDWRRRHVVDAPAVFSDTIGVFQVTARELLNHALRVRADRLVLIGSSALTLALLDELAQHRREEAEFSAPSSLDVVVVDPEAAELLADHELHQSRYGNVGLTGPTGAGFEGSPASATVVGQLVAGCERPLVVDTREPSSSSLRAAERLAARLPACQVLVWTDDEQGIADEALMGNLRAFGLTLLADGKLPEDGWERIARRQHERHVAADPDPTGTAPGRRPWPELSDFYRQSNLRQIATTMKIAHHAGRSWTRPAASSTGASPLSDAEIDALAHHEHEAWRHYLFTNGWRYGPDRSDHRLRHPNLLDWSSLDDEARLKARDGVRNSFALLATLGYHPFPVADPSAASPEPTGTDLRPFRRIGRVRAKRQDQPWSWTSASGHQMSGEAGDWLVTGEDGGQWSIRDADLRRTYTHVADDVWERSGAVRARPGRPGEVVETQEGPTVVRHTDWVVEDELQHRWVVPDAQFRASYTDRQGRERP